MPRRALSRWMIPLYSLLALALVPWVLWLAWTLPASSVTSHYRLAWVGFDVLLAGSMARTAYLAWRRSPFVVNVASATATLLVVDAWFDVTTSPGGDELVRSALLAVFVELPLAALSLVLAGRAQIEIARTGAVAPRPRVLQWVAAQSLGDSLADAVGKGRATAAMPSASALDVASPQMVTAGPSLAAPKTPATGTPTSAAGLTRPSGTTSAAPPP